MTDLSLARHIAAVLADGATDIDPGETAEWCEALDALVATQGPERARFLFDALLAHARRRGLRWLPAMTTPYVNSIALEAQPPFPGDLAMEQRLAALMRWNALAMVMRANRVESGGSAELGGHIASYASAADLFEVGFNHFFRARNRRHRRRDQRHGGRRGQARRSRVLPAAFGAGCLCARLPGGPLTPPTSPTTGRSWWRRRTARAA